MRRLRHAGYSYYTTFISILLSCVTPYTTHKLNIGDEDGVVTHGNPRGFTSFNAEDQAFSDYLDLFEHYVVAREIPESRQKAVFLCSVGA